MDIFDKFFKKFSYKFPKGYPDMNNTQDVFLLESILKELGIDLEGVNLSSEKNIKLVNDLAQANNNIASQQGIRAKLEGELKTLHNK